MLAVVVAACGVGAGGSTTRTFHGVPLAPNIRCNDAQCTSYNVVPYVRTRSQYGVGCLGNVPPGTTPKPELPPQSYSAAFVGKPGFPKLTPHELATLHRIQHHVHSKTLRIAWLGSPPAGEFIIFDATDGPCEIQAAGYQILNGARNEFYTPGENPYGTYAAPG